MPLADGLLNKIRFKVLGGNVGLLKHDVIPWPLLLRNSEFAEDRKEIERQLSEARAAALNKDMNPAALNDLRALLAKANGRVTVLLKSDAIGAGDYTEAKRLIRDLDDSVNVMRRPHEAALLLEKPPACRSVPELVRHMADNGLRFNRATDGDERFYFILHHALTEQSRRLGPGR